MSQRGIEHRVARGRLHPVRTGVYAVGRPELSRHGRWMAAVLASGPKAALSHSSAAALWQLAAERPGLIEVSVPVTSRPRRRGVLAHRRTLPAHDLWERDGIPVTGVVLTMVDLAASFDLAAIERAVREADTRNIIDPDSLRLALDGYRGIRGVARLRDALDCHGFRLTDSELERLFLSIVRETGLPLPRTQQRVNGFRVDFYWPELGLVVETDGLSYHRTPAQQSRDLIRDQRHTAAGMTPLRFTFAQVKQEPAYVKDTLEAVASGLLLAPNR